MKAKFKVLGGLNKVDQRRSCELKMMLSFEPVGIVNSKVGRDMYPAGWDTVHWNFDLLISAQIISLRYVKQHLQW